MVAPFTLSGRFLLWDLGLFPASRCTSPNLSPPASARLVPWFVTVNNFKRVGTFVHLLVCYLLSAHFVQLWLRVSSWLVCIFCTWNWPGGRPSTWQASICRVSGVLQRVCQALPTPEALMWVLWLCLSPCNPNCTACVTRLTHLSWWPVRSGEVPITPAWDPMGKLVGPGQASRRHGDHPASSCLSVQGRRAVVQDCGWHRVLSGEGAHVSSSGVWPSLWLSWVLVT